MTEVEGPNLKPLRLQEVKTLNSSPFTVFPKGRIVQATNFEIFVSPAVCLKGFARAFLLLKRLNKKRILKAVLPPKHRGLISSGNYA
jgi:hypothetical protein